MCYYLTRIQLLIAALSPDSRGEIREEFVDLGSIVGLTLDFWGRIEEAGILVHLRYEPVLTIVGENFRLKFRPQ
jgi:hypothetical protein